MPFLLTDLLVYVIVIIWQIQVFLPKYPIKGAMQCHGKAKIIDRYLGHGHNQAIVCQT